MIARWRKSSYSTGGDSGGTDCVEVAGLGAIVGIRDSKAADRGHLTVTRESLASLISCINRQGI
ncbi:DUF397 domain-containing protein [Actinomadura harenae]|uniref:DUF397 domain-containing protein n=1 Tax=Actinomadura harenae TaxID=2483351 RepID=A0A3M2LUH8_9ACTN|nr:DUF397 domain-containing protein [Actinomadura harenae]RMI40193.1 DUF397 domain-containing protein [Actinomadura harenae]